MTTLRKLELAGGILTAAIGTYVGFTLIYLDYQTSQRHAEPFPIESGVIFFSYLLTSASGDLLWFVSSCRHTKATRTVSFNRGSVGECRNVCLADPQPLCPLRQARSFLAEFAVVSSRYHYYGFVSLRTKGGALAGVRLNALPSPQF